MLKCRRKRLQPKNIVRKPALTFSYQEEWMKYNKNVKNNFLTFKAQNQRKGCHPKKTGEGGGLQKGAQQCRGFHEQVAYYCQGRQGMVCFYVLEIL
jgi:hypothetical protein